MSTQIKLIDTYDTLLERLSSLEEIPNGKHLKWLTPVLDLRAQGKVEKINNDMEIVSQKLASLFNCPFCFHVYTKKSSVNDHVARSHPDAEKPHKRRVRDPEKAKMASRVVKLHIQFTRKEDISAFLRETQERNS